MTVITHGKKGVTAYDSHGTLAVPGEVAHVVNTVGAGNAFMAVLHDANALHPTRPVTRNVLSHV